MPTGGVVPRVRRGLGVTTGGVVWQLPPWVPGRVTVFSTGPRVSAPLPGTRLATFSAMLPLSPVVPLRPYQDNCGTAILSSLDKVRATLAVMATGLGKTRTAKAIVASYFLAGMRVLWLVDTDDLVWQARDALGGDPYPLPVDVDKSRRKAEPWSKIVVASKQTLQSHKRLSRYETNAFDLIVADEAHKSMSPGWFRIFDYFSGAKVLGLTATPDRADCKSLMDFYEDVPYELEIRDAIREGWLVPLVQKFVRVSGLDYSQVRREAMKLREGDMEAALLNAEMIEQMAVPTVELSGQRQNLIFTCSVDHAYAFAAFLRKMGIEAETVEGDKTRCPPKRRREIIAAFKRGDIHMLTNCATLTTGFDAPATSAVTFARPMISRALYAQCCGRGTRSVVPQELNALMHGSAEQRRMAIANSAKPNCLLLDFMGNAGRLKLVRSAAALDPDLDDETAELAEKIAEEKQLDMNAALDVAEEMREELLKEVEQRDGAAKHEYEVTEIDPFEGSRSQQVFRLVGIPSLKDRWGLPATDAQVQALKNWKVPDAEVLDRRQASDLLATLGKRKDSGLASYRQIELLVNVGKLPLDQVRRLDHGRAARGLTMLKDNKWKRPEEWGPVKYGGTGS